MPHRMHLIAATAPLALLGLASPALSQPVTALPEIRVWATPEPTPDNVRIAGVTVLSGEELRATGAATVNRALAERLGLPLRHDLNNSGNDTLDLRGFGINANDNLAIIVDGLRLNHADMTAPALNLVPLGDIERIEIRRGGQAVLFGEGATGGAIVVTTRQATEPGTQGSITVGAGNQGQRLLQGRLGHTAGDWTLQAGWQGQQADNHRNNADSRLSQASASLAWQQPGQRIRLRAEQARNEARLPGSLTAAQYRIDPRQTFRPDDWTRSQLNGISLDASASVAQWQLFANLAWRDQNIQSELFGATDFDLTMRQLGVRAERSFELGDYRHETTIGLSRLLWERDESIAFGSRASINRMSSGNRDWYARHLVTHAPSGMSLGAGYRQASIERERQAKAGGAASSLQDRPDAWELALGAPAPLGSVRLSVGTSYRAANLDELAPGVATLPLRIQTSRDVEAAWLWEHARVSGQIRLYRHRLADELFFDSNLFLNTNLPPTERKGIEAELGYRLDAHWTVTAALRDGSARFRSGANGGRDIPLAFTDSLQIRLDWRQDAHQASLGLQQVRGAAVNERNECRTPDYTLLSAGYAYRSGAVTWRISGQNLTDERFYTYAFACAGGQVSNGIYPEPGRRILLSMSYAF